MNVAAVVDVAVVSLGTFGLALETAKYSGPLTVKLDGQELTLNIRNGRVRGAVYTTSTPVPLDTADRRSSD